MSSDSVATRGCQAHNRPGSRTNHSDQNGPEFITEPRSLGRSLTGGLLAEDLGRPDLTGFCAPGPLPYPVAIPGDLVRPSNESVRAWPSRRVGTTVQEQQGSYHQECAPPCSIRVPLLRLASHQSGNSRGQHGWHLTGASRDVAEVSLWRNQAPHLSWRTQVYDPGWPRGLTLPPLSPEQRGYRVFIDGHVHDTRLWHWQC